MGKIQRTFADILSLLRVFVGWPKVLLFGNLAEQLLDRSEASGF